MSRQVPCKPGGRKGCLDVALLAVLAGLSLSCGTREASLPSTTDSTAEDEPSHGRFVRVRQEQDDNEGQDSQLLRSLGYLGATNLATTDRVVTVHDTRAQDGLGLYTSGHGPEAFLIDKSGRELHRWRKEIHEVWPDAPPVEPRRHYFRDAAVYPNGDLLVMYADAVPGLIRIDRSSDVVWSNLDLWAHHALEIQADGSAYVLTRRVQVVPSVDETSTLR